MRALLCLTACVAIGCGGTSSIDNGPSTTSSTTTLYGRVWLTRIPAQGSTQFSAQFGGAAPANVVHEQAFGDCYTQPYPSAPASNQFDSAGTLELLGTTTPWQVQPGSNMSYSSIRTTDEWSEGAQLEVRATGAQAPAFDTTVIAPPTLRFLNDRAALVEAVTGNADVALQWMPVDADQVWIGVESGNQQVTCTWTGATGHGTIPGAALAALPPSGRTIRSPVALNSHVFQSNAWSINVIAQSRSEFPDGSSL